MQSKEERLAKRRLRYKARYPTKTPEQKRKERGKVSPEQRARINAWHREYRKNNPEVLRAADKRKRLKLLANDPARALWYEIRKRAKRQKVAFDLGVEDLVYPTTCPILGIPLFQTAGCQTDNTPSLDRLVPARGYVKGNCFFISNKANRMKQDNTLEDFQKIITYIQERLPLFEGER